MTDLQQPDVKLRAIEPEDLDMLYTIENDDELWGVGTTNVPYSRYTLYDYVANAKNDIYTDRQVRLIVENHSGTAVGMVDIIDFDPRHMRAEIGIVIQKAHRRRGYAAAALAKAVSYAVQTLNLHQLYAIVPADNDASATLFENNGFKRAAELKDWLKTGGEFQNAWLFQFFS